MIMPKSGFAASSRFTVSAFTHHHHRYLSSTIQTNPLLLQQQKFQPAPIPAQPVAVQTRMATSLGGANSILPEFIANVGPVKAIGSFVGVVSLLALLRYRNAIKRRIRLVREESWLFGAGVTMERIDSSQHKAPRGVFQNLQLMEMNPEFAAQAKKDGHQLVSLGDYMATLRPKGLPKKISVEDTPKIIQREIEAGLTAGLLKVLGPNLGRALLPAIGGGFIQRKAQGLAASIATKWVLTPEGSISSSLDKAGIPVSLMTLLAISDTNAKINSGGKPVEDQSVANLSLNAVDKMKVGEVVKGPNFANGLSDTSLIPNDFVISKDFDQAIMGMEQLLAGDPEKGETTETALKVAQEDAIKNEEFHKDAREYKAQKSTMQYDPEDLKAGAPVPVNPRLFPGLYLGWGDALMSHTKREVLKMRVLSLLLNKLGANYYRQTHKGDQELFQVRMKEGDKPITRPCDLVQALIDSGHKVEVVPTSRMTTFGMALCVKEKNGSWSNIPLGVFLESGYEDKDGNMAPAMMPHSGLDMFITGPLAGERKDGTPSELRLQHFVGIEGFCGWHAHANPQVPFNEAIEQGPRLSGDKAVRAARIAGLYANVLNGLATEMELPYGGYGLTAVCNDSAALVQQCLYGVNTIYPMTSVGRFMLRTMRYAQRFKGELQSRPDMELEVNELQAIIDAMKDIPSDLNSSPGSAHSAAVRTLATMQPKVPLLLMKDSKDVMEAILREDTILEAKDATPEAKPEHVEKVMREKETANGSKKVV